MGGDGTLEASVSHTGLFEDLGVPQGFIMGRMEEGISDKKEICLWGYTCASHPLRSPFLSAPSSITALLIPMKQGKLLGK